MNILLSILLWFVFGIIHSYFARPLFKVKIKKIFGEIFEKHFYRFFYFISQCMLFYFIYELIKNLDHGIILFQIPNQYELIYYLFYIFSNLFLILSVLQFNVSEFIGLKQIIEYFKKKKIFDSQDLNTDFLYKYLRHPMYLGIILVYIFSHTIFTEIFFVNLFCIIFYIEIGSYYEEKTLLKKYGEKYKIYKQRSYKYIPFIR
jgi:hypothetical protein